MAPPRGGFAPNLEKFLESLALPTRPVESSIESLIQLLKWRKIKGPEACATATALLLAQVVARDKWTDVDELIARIQTAGRRLVAAQPRELVINNVVKRVLQLVRAEAEEDRNEVEGGESTADPHSPAAVEEAASPPQRSTRPGALASLGPLARTQSVFNILSDPEISPFQSSNGLPGSGVGSGTSTPRGPATPKYLAALKDEVVEGIDEIVDEIRQVDEQVQTYSDIMIHPGDYILVYKPSRTVQRFLTRSKRKITVLLMVDPSNESGADLDYALFRKGLAANGSTLVNIMNTGAMAYMPRVNKVILEARAMSAKGDVIADGGALVIAHAAKDLGRTVIILGAVYKIAPMTELDHDAAVEWGDPSQYVSYSEGELVGRAKVRNAVSELVPAELVDTYITNLGAHSRDHLHTLVEDHYHEADIDLDLYGKIRV